MIAKLTVRGIEVKLSGTPLELVEVVRELMGGPSIPPPVRVAVQAADLEQARARKPAPVPKARAALPPPPDLEDEISENGALATYRRLTTDDPPPKVRSIWTTDGKALALWEHVSPTWKARLKALAMSPGHEVEVEKLVGKGTKAGPEFAGLTTVCRGHAVGVNASPVQVDNGVATLDAGFAEAMRGFA